MGELRAPVGAAPHPGARTSEDHRVLWEPPSHLDLGRDASGDLPRYRSWAERRQTERLAAAGAGPSDTELAVLIPLVRPDPDLLRDCLRSIAGQTAGGFVSLAVAGPLEPTVRAVVDEELAALPGGRGSLEHCPDGTTEAGAVASALRAAPGTAVVVLGQHDRLAPDALALLAQALATADLAYGDEDRTDDAGAASDPLLKPDWSPELHLSYPYLGRPVAVRRQLLVACGGIRPVTDGDWEHDLYLRATERTDRVAHVPEVLCHRGPVADVPGGPGAVKEAVHRRGIDASVAAGSVPRSWTVHRHLVGRPSVSAIICFRDGAPLLRTCVDSVTATVGDLDLQLVLVDNGSVESETRTLVDRLERRPDVTVLRDDRAFNWAALNNAAIDVADGKLLLFLNNDIEARRTGWMEALAAQALRPEVGAVGARLLYPSGRVQHVGVVIGMGGAAGHVLCGLPGEQPGYLGMAVLARDCSAVTGACLITRREVFEELGRFDETLGLDMNDIDFCLRARERGLSVVFEPAAELVHYESPSRGTSGSVDDISRFIDRWERVIVEGDPFLSSNLTRLDCSCSLRTTDEGGWWESWRSTLARS